MIIDEQIAIKVNARHASYWREKGYHIPPVGGRKPFEGGDRGHEIMVKVKDLPSQSNIKVRCQCEKCGDRFTTKYSRTVRRSYNWCQSCILKTKMIGNSRSKSGKDHHRWNKNATEFQRYSTKVRVLTEKTYREYKDVINPQGLKRGRMGIDGAHQVDHKISVWYGFQNNMPPEIIAAVDNLQMLPWQENASKASKYIAEQFHTELR